MRAPERTLGRHHVSTTTEEPQVPAERVPLDQVMLAMDVVDTLRHQQQLVERELDDARQQAELIARIQGIYDAQGIEVSEETIAEGVRALRDDRFVYRPPERTWRVRLAEIYVERGKWTLRLLLVAALAVAGWLAWALPARAERRREIEVFQSRVESALERAEDLEARITRLSDDIAGARERSEGAGTAEPLQQAEAGLERGRAATGAALADLAPRPDAAAAVDGDAATVGRLVDAERKLDQARAELDAARVQVDGIVALAATRLEFAALERRIDGLELTDGERPPIDALRGEVRSMLDAGRGARAAARLGELRDALDAVLAAREARTALASRFARIRAALDAIPKTPDAAREVTAGLTAARSALDAGDSGRAARALDRLEELATTLELSYQLRIVSRPGTQSGVWRYPNGDRSKRNHYVIVEAIDAAGRTLRLPITSEEDGSTRTVKQFGVRVPERVYEQVKADKLDNGLIDAPLAGEKTRGALEPTWVLEVLPGRITRW